MVVFALITMAFAGAQAGPLTGHEDNIKFGRALFDLILGIGVIFGGSRWRTFVLFRVALGIIWLAAIEGARADINVLVTALALLSIVLLLVPKSPNKLTIGLGIFAALSSVATLLAGTINNSRSSANVIAMNAGEAVTAEKYRFVVPSASWGRLGPAAEQRMPVKKVFWLRNQEVEAYINAEFIESSTGGRVNVTRMERSVLDNYRRQLGGVELISSDPLPTKSATGQAMHFRAGQFEYLVAVVPGWRVGFQIDSFAAPKDFKKIEADVRAVFQSFEIRETNLDREQLRLQQRILASKSIGSRVAATKQGESAEREIGLELAQKGMPKVSETHLARRVEILLDLSKRSPTFCAALGRGTLTESQLLDGLAGLSETQIRDWFELSFAAIEAEASDAPIAPPIEGAVERAFAALFKKSPDAARLQTLLSKMAGATDEDVCWANTVLFKEALDLSPPHRAVLLRAFVTR